MRILSITAQKPNSTGSGVFLTELVRALGETGQEQMAVGGIYPEDRVELPTLINTDEPEEKELPAFEERLAAAIKDSMKAGRTEPADVSLLTGSGLPGLSSGTDP